MYGVEGWYVQLSCVFFFKQETAYEMRISDWSSDGCSSDLVEAGRLDADVAACVPRQAQTLHRLLGWQRPGRFRHDAALPLHFDVVVVDEASMVDLPLMARLVAPLAPAAPLVLPGGPRLEGRPVGQQGGVTGQSREIHGNH